MKFNRPEIEIICFETNDVIATSGELSAPKYYIYNGYAGWLYDYSAPSEEIPGFEGVYGTRAPDDLVWSWYRNEEHTVGFWKYEDGKWEYLGMKRP